MFAVFQSGGKQHRVTEGDVVRLELLEPEPGDEGHRQWFTEVKITSIQA